MAVPRAGNASEGTLADVLAALGGPPTSVIGNVGDPAPTSATLTAGVDATGDLQGVATGRTTPTATLVEFLNTLAWAVFHTAPTTRTNGQGGPLEADPNGNLRTIEQYGFSNARVTSSGATNAIKTGAGVIHSISVDKWVTGLVIDFYDALTVTGTPIRKITLTSTDTGPIPASVIDIPFTTGLTVNLSAGADVGISYR